MSGSMSRSVREIKDGLHSIIEPALIMGICQILGHTWRDRKLGPVETIGLFVAQVLHGNSSCAHVRQLGNFAFTPGAYCGARMRLPVELFRRLLQAAGEKLSARGDQVGLWRGHRIVGIDGSSFSMSHNKALWAKYPWKVSDLGIEFPIARFVAMFDLVTGALMDIVPATMRDHELATSQHLINRLRRGDVVVADRLYSAFGFLGQLVGRQVHFVIRVPVKTRNVDFRPKRPHAKHKHWKGVQSVWIRKLGALDQVVEWIKPAGARKWLGYAEWASIPERLRVRELRYQVKRNGFRATQVTLVTNLLDPVKYPKSALAELYGLRWQAETNLRHLKATMRMDVLRCQTVEGVQRELLVFGLVYNAVRLVMLQAALEQGTSPDQVSFVDALRWITSGCRGDHLPTLIVNPHRARSPAPRMKRRRPKSYMKMRYARAPQRQTPGEPRLIT